MSQSKNILVLGASGMAGHVTAVYLREQGFNVDTLSAHNKLDEKTYIIDVTDPQKFKDFLNSKSYDAVINCIGILVRQSEERKDLAAYINAYLPHFLEEYYKSTNTRLIHLSSDGVFSSKVTPPYKEDESDGGDDFYGRSKALGEINNSKDLTFRMSIVGPDLKPDGAGLFNWFMQQKGEISGYDKVIWNGITTIELAKAIKTAIDQKLSGIYHLAPTENISKYNLLLLFKQVFDKDSVTVNPNSGAISNRTLANTRSDFDFKVPNYETMIRDMKDWMEKHKDIYTHYYGQK